jgi:rubredoxin
MKCKVCGYVYDPASGDARGGIAPGVPFTTLSEDWVCPTCRAPKFRFAKA